MIKKNSWIVALLLALSFTTFFSCVDAYVEEEDDLELVVELGEFNYEAGQKYQLGWATDGHSEAKEKLGYKASDWKKADTLVLELKGDNGFEGGFTVIWGGEPKTAVNTTAEYGSGWINKKLVNDNGTPISGAGLILSSDKKTARIKLNSLLDSEYFFNTAVTELKICLEYNGGGPKTPEDLVAKAGLYKSKVFDPVENIIPNLPTTAVWKTNIKLDATVTPDKATKSKIIWSIVGFLPKDGDEGDWDAGDFGDWLTIKGKPDGTDAEKLQYTNSKTALLAKVDFIAEEITYVKPSTYLDYSVYPPKETVITESAITYNGKSSDTIKAQAAGTVKVQALVLGGGKKDKDGKDTDFKQTFDITIIALNESVKKDVDLSSAKNGGHAAAATVTATATSYNVTPTTGDYEDNYAQFKVNLTTLSETAGAKTLANVAKIYFDVETTGTDGGYKSPKLWVSNTEWIGRQGGEPSAVDGINNGIVSAGTTYNLEFEIKDSMVKAGVNDASEVWLSIFVNGGNSLIYDVSNVKISFWEPAP